MSMLAFVIIIDLVNEFGGHTAATDLAFSREENDWRLMAKKMRAVQIPKAKGPLEVVEREIPEPKSGWVRVKVEACGVCHSDSLVKDGLWPGIQYPRIPGHEVIGVIDAVGPDVPDWKSGQRAGVGWHASHCGHCDPCRRGDFVACQVEVLTTGISFDGGYAEYMVAPAKALASVPDDLNSIEGAPLMCAGITTFNALRNSGARAGDLVGVLGIGGLGHLGIQYAAKSGYRVVGVGRGPENAALAKKLGAFAYIDRKATKPAEELQKLGGAKVILATAPSAKAIAELVDGLSVGGKLVIVGAPVEPMEISVLQLLLARRAIQGWPSGTAMDSQETLQFSAFAGVRPMIEKYPLAKVKDAYERMTSGHAEFRVVLTMD